MSGITPVKKRLLVFLGTLLLWQLVVLGKVLYLKVFRGEEYQQLARSQKEDVIQVPASRGKILDRHLEQLAVSVPLQSVFVYTPNVEDKTATSQALAQALGLKAGDIRAKLDGKLKFRYIKRFVTAEKARQIKELSLPGVGFLQENQRFYPNGKLAAHVIGAITHRNGMEVGLEGLEKEYDEELSGYPGELYLQKDGLRNVLTTREITAPQPGNTLVLNIDSQIQYVAQKELAAAVQSHKARNGMIVVMEPDSGRIMALATYPDYDPNNLRGIRQSNLRDQAIEHYFEPGSTFKIVTVSAALEENLTSPEEIIYCGNGSISLSGHIIRDHHPFENLSVNEIIANSSDVGAIKLGLRLGDDGLYNYIKTFGFGERTGIDLPAEVPGYIRPTSRWSGISIGSISMGQEVGVTALQITRAMAAIANGGYLVRPYIVSRVLDENGKLIHRNEPERVRIISERTARMVRRALVETVDDGTAKRAIIPGYRVAGKTGTAQKYDPEVRTYSSTDFVASFVGFAPADHPVAVIGVIIDSPRPRYHGGEVSAPVFEEVMRQILLLKKIQPEETAPLPELAALPPRKAPTSPLPAAPPVKVSPAPADSLLSVSDGPRETVITLIPEGSFIMPDFSGKSLRSVIHECSRIGLDLQPSGSGIAVEQIPPAGVRITPRTRCTVWFSNDMEKIAQLLDLPVCPVPSSATPATRHLSAMKKGSSPGGDQPPGLAMQRGQRE